MDEEDDVGYMTCKVVLLGETGVGKTSIISRYVTNKFSDVLMSTTGASYATKKIEIDSEHKIKLQIWDTAGQEKFRSLAKIFYQNSSVAVLVYDITRRDTFEQLKEFWHQQIKESAIPDIILGIAANKCDLYDDEEVKEEEGREFAEKIGAFYKLTSASSNQGIEELFKTVGNRFLDPNYSFNTSGKNKNLKIGGDTPNIKKKKKCC